jgi:Pyruvate/2-oxoacid:ferredoxin oxidoreductase gamma subunit
MSITEASRFQLRTAMGLILSEEAADTLMELLPPVGWANVATKTDIQHLRDEMKADMRALQLTIEIAIEKRIHEQTKWLITTMIAMNTVMLAASVALSKLI